MQTEVDYIPIIKRLSADILDSRDRVMRIRILEKMVAVLSGFLDEMILG